MKNIKMILWALGFLYFDSPTFASLSFEEYTHDLATLNAIAQQAPLNMSEFISKWKPKLRQVKHDATVYEYAERQWHAMSESFSAQLHTSYNPMGLEFFMEHGTLKSKLALALDYFTGHNIVFHPLNQPANMQDPLFDAARIYLAAFNEIKKKSIACKNEFLRAAADAPFSSLNLSFLFAHQKSLALMILKNLLNTQQGKKLNDVEIMSFRLDELMESSRRKIELILHQICNQMIGADVQYAAYCMLFIMGNRHLAEEIYMQACERQRLIQAPPLLPFMEWVNQAQPYTRAVPMGT